MAVWRGARPRGAIGGRTAARQALVVPGGGSIIHLINQPAIGDKVELKVEKIVFLDKLR